MKLVRFIFKDNEFTAIIVSGHSRFLKKRSGWFGITAWGAVGGALLFDNF